LKGWERFRPFFIFGEKTQYVTFFYWLNLFSFLSGFNFLLPKRFNRESTGFLLGNNLAINNCVSSVGAGYLFGLLPKKIGFLVKKVIICLSLSACLCLYPSLFVSVLVCVPTNK